MHLEGVDEVLPESLELLRNISFAGNVNGAPGESSGNRLVNVDDVGEVIPPRRCKVSASSGIHVHCAFDSYAEELSLREHVRVRVGEWLVLSGLPEEGSC